MNGKVWDLRLAQNDPTDIKGIPYYSKEDNKMRWADPDELPSEEEASQLFAQIEARCKSAFLANGGDGGAGESKQ